MENDPIHHKMASFDRYCISATEASGLIEVF